jgi:hypothetical protein
MDAALALDELLECEGTPYEPPPGGSPRGGRRLRLAASGLRRALTAVPRVLTLAGELYRT